MTIKVFANPGGYNLPSVLIAQVNRDEEITSVCRVVTFEEVKPNDCYAPTLVGRAGLEFLKSALNAAWAYGIRPDGWKEPEPVVIPAPGREGEIARMERHIADLQRLVFGSRETSRAMAEIIDDMRRQSMSDEEQTSKIATGD